MLSKKSCNNFQFVLDVKRRSCFRFFEISSKNLVDQNIFWSKKSNVKIVFSLKNNEKKKFYKQLKNVRKGNKIQK